MKKTGDCCIRRSSILKSCGNRLSAYIAAGKLAFCDLVGRRHRCYAIKLPVRSFPFEGAGLHQQLELPLDHISQLTEMPLIDFQTLAVCAVYFFRIFLEQVNTLFYAHEFLTDFITIAVNFYVFYVCH